SPQLLPRPPRPPLFPYTTLFRSPYGMTVADNIAPALVARLRADARYDERRLAIAAFNAASPLLKRGIALTPVKFGISFTTTHLKDRKSTRLNSSHVKISYAVFCL